ncbi:MAG: NAD-dependent epimerase/dehydratase family protein [Candidatus Omnitrophica bacterium]|nr:NAD-dependent epimerase/dehydratase family protein [Candidatus Omnitrophota bacterium]
MKYTTILVTGGAGFVGSNLAVSFKSKYPKLKVIALDNLKRRGSELNLKPLKENGVDFIHADIRNQEDLVLKNKIDLVIECSAEPSVLAGFGDNPGYIINTNLNGTVNCLELCRKHKSDIIFLSTSRVYPYEALNRINSDEKTERFSWKAGQKIEGWTKKGINEKFPLEGAKTLYGATKLCSELILQEYLKNYGLKGLVNRLGVIAGPGQFGKVDQGVFTFWMLAHYFKRNLEYIGFGGKGKQVRDLMHIDDLFALIDIEAASLEKLNGKIYNAGGGSINLSLKEATALCSKITGNSLKLRPNKLNRPGDIKIYITDNSAAEKDLHWHPKKGPEEIMLDTFNWIRENEKALKQI